MTAMTIKRKPKEAVGHGPAAVWPEPIDGLGWGARIHRHHDPKHWREQLEKVPAEHRAGAETYLRGIAARMRVVARIKAAKGEA